MDCKKHPCQSWACSLQACLAGHHYNIDKCQGVLNSLIQCCAHKRTLDGPCEGFRDEVEEAINVGSSWSEVRTSVGHYILAVVLSRSNNSFRSSGATGRSEDYMVRRQRYSGYRRYQMIVYIDLTLPPAFKEFEQVTFSTANSDLQHVQCTDIAAWHLIGGIVCSQKMNCIIWTIISCVLGSGN